MGLQICFQKKRQVVAGFFDTYYTSTICIGFFWEPKNHKIPHWRRAIYEAPTWIIQKGAPLSLPDANNFQQRFCLTRSCSGSRTVRPFQEKKNKLQKSGFCEHKKSEEFLSLKNSEELRKKKHQETFNNQAPRPKTYPKNLHTKVLSNPNICFPTTPFVPNFRRRSAIFLRRSAKGSSSPAWKKVVLASSTWGIGTSRLDYLNKLGKTAGKSRKRCSFSFKKDII